MPTIHQWLLEYGERHKNETNKANHWICVPVIFFSITRLLYGIKLPLNISGFSINVAIIPIAVLMVYYFLISKTLWIGMLLFGVTYLVL